MVHGRPSFRLLTVVYLCARTESPTDLRFPGSSQPAQSFLKDIGELHMSVYVVPGIIFISLQQLSGLFQSQVI